MSRLEVELFDPPPDPDLICAVCQCVLSTPTEASRCRHVFCHECITTWLNSGARTCPTCRSVLTSNELRRALPALCNVIGRLMMKCVNYSSGCDVQLNVERLETHLTAECQWVKQRCECGAEILRRDLDAHKDACVHCLFPCTSCQLMITTKEEASHNCILALQQIISGQKYLLKELMQEPVRIESISQHLRAQLKAFSPRTRNFTSVLPMLPETSAAQLAPPASSPIPPDLDFLIALDPPSPPNRAINGGGQQHRQAETERSSAPQSLGVPQSSGVQFNSSPSSPVDSEAYEMEGLSGDEEWSDYEVYNMHSNDDYDDSSTPPVSPIRESDSEIDRRSYPLARLNNTANELSGSRTSSQGHDHDYAVESRPAASRASSTQTAQDAHHRESERNAARDGALADDVQRVPVNTSTAARAAGSPVALNDDDAVQYSPAYQPNHAYDDDYGDDVSHCSDSDNDRSLSSIPSEIDSDEMDEDLNSRHDYEPDAEDSRHSSIRSGRTILGRDDDFSSDTIIAGFPIIRSDVSNDASLDENTDVDDYEQSDSESYYRDYMPSRHNNSTVASLAPSLDENNADELEPNGLSMSESEARDDVSDAESFASVLSFDEDPHQTSRRHSPAHSHASSPPSWAADSSSESDQSRASVGSCTPPRRRRAAAVKRRRQSDSSGSDRSRKQLRLH